MARINYVLLDFENIQESDWDRIAGKPVKVLLVYGQQKRYFDLATVSKLLACSSQLEFIESKKSGRNAADLIIAERIGELRSNDPSGYFHIVSRDKGFDSLVENLRAKKVLAARRQAFREIPILMNLGERVAHVRDYITQKATGLPGKLTTLQSQIQVFFGKGLADAEVAAIIDALKEQGVLTIGDRGKVTYRS